MRNRKTKGLGRSFLKRLLILAVAISVVQLIPALSVAAADLIDPNRNDGSIDLTMQYSMNNQMHNMIGGTLCLYKVAGVKYDNGNEVFDTSKGKFTGYENIRAIESKTTQQLATENATLGRNLAAYVLSAKVSADQAKTINNGKVAFTNLNPGLYLVYQTAYSQGNIRVSPYLVSIPNENRQYQIVGRPKPTVYGTEEGDETESETPGPTPTPTPTPTITPVPTPTPTKPPIIPQTGQLWWPVPLLAILGVLLITAGVVRRKRSR